jgi:hypothetical protein
MQCVLVARGFQWYKSSDGERHASHVVLFVEEEIVGVVVFY